MPNPQQKRLQFNRHSKHPPYLEDLIEGATIDYPSVNVTQEMRDRHVELYGEDWPDEVVAEAKERGVVPGPMLMSIVGGQWGVNNLLAIKALKEISVRFFIPFTVGDTIVPDTTIAKVIHHKDPAKDYGYVEIVQNLHNQDGQLCCRRDITFCVNRKIKA